MAPLRGLRGVRDGALIARVRPIRRASPGGSVAQSKNAARAPSRAKKVTCEECYFRVNMLCALALDEPCATFRPNEAQLRPPPQLRFVFRQERRARAAWAFPSAQEQAALHA